jgi:putative spermidine/putrescine transport system ATP-binding protein
MSDVELQRVSKSYGGGVKAVDDLSLHIREGEFLFLLGPSGCGKTTTLRMVAGFVKPDEGVIAIGGRDISRIPPYGRDLGMVFQSYALFPHMTVAENVAFGLRMRRVSKDEMARRVATTLDMVELGGLGGRYPRQLSGGQQQRVALARAIVIQPKALLLDEPLSNLDAKLRQQMRLELKTLQERLGVTTIFVTHDQEEALVMADRIAVMRDGRIEQLGSPTDLYERPASKFVAHFIGETNFIHGTVAERPVGDRAVLRVGDGFAVTGRCPEPIVAGRPAVAAIRPERVEIGQTNGHGVRGTVEQVIYMGALVRYKVALPARQSCLAQTGNRRGVDGFQPGEAVSVSWSDDDVLILADEGPDLVLAEEDTSVA